MKVIMTGGGTGGHIYPAIAIADKIKENNPNTEILFVGTERGLEKTIVPKHGYPIEFITVEGLNRKNLIKNVEVAYKLMKGNSQAKNIVKEFKPDMVIGTGGYVCAPVIKAGHKFGAKVYLHEQNAFPGITNKVLEKYADGVFLGFADGAKHFKYPEKHVLTGNPVRKEFLQAEKTDARIELGFKQDDFILLAFGGSQGAGRINKAMLDVIEAFNNSERIQICIATGSYYYEAIINELRERGVEPADNIHIMEYISNMDKYLSAADLIISRSGALTVAEVAVSGKPAIFIPSPIVTNNHQYYNAKAVADHEGAIILPEEELSGERLIKEIMRFKNDKNLLSTMSAASKACAYTDAADVIYSHLNME